MARILLAEDAPATCEMVRHALAGEGHEVVTTHDGIEALEHIEGGGVIDLLISDIDMPGLDGVGLVEKALAARPGLKVILMSGFASGLERADSLKARTGGILPKPFSLDQIRAAVRSALG
ncbi:MAG: response regulator [Hyphomicrobiaceae bacterium]|nr:response regulator [Hyphomicrobiaceae bacterium]